MIRGFILVVVAGYSIIFLKRKLFRHEGTAIVIIIIGCLFAGISSVLYDKSSKHEAPAYGIIFLLIGELFEGGVYVSEELFLKNIRIDPILAIGIEGLAGFLIYLILLP